jgi:Fur family transcriptional regulator, ferric uptake regulator
MPDVDELLENKNLSRTPCRVEILKVLKGSDSALTEPEIREQLAYNFDRTTVYRTLRSFLIQDVIHSISVEGKEVKYAINHLHETATSNYHVHFSCNHCKGVYCISHEAFEIPQIPEKYLPLSYDLLIHGLCNKCDETSITKT